MSTFNEPNARDSDPETSHEAAEDAKFKASKHRLLALTTLRRFGPLTDFELASRTGIQQTSIGKRRKECQDAGLVTGLVDANGQKVKRPAPSGSSALVWTLTQEGITYATANLVVQQSQNFSAVP
jgi:predicted transcriptional regulator